MGKKIFGRNFEILINFFGDLEEKFINIQGKMPINHHCEAINFLRKFAQKSLNLNAFLKSPQRIATFSQNVKFLS